MDDFRRLDAARGQLFRAVNRAVNNAVFGLLERSALNDLLANPLAADHLLLLETEISAQPADALQGTADLLSAAAETIDAVNEGANSRAERRRAIDKVDAACAALMALLDAAALASGVSRTG